MRWRRRFAPVVLAEDQGQGEQGLDQEKTLSGSRMQPAVVSDLMEACGQDMLKEAGKESDRIENERFGFAGLRLDVSECDVTILIADEPLIAQRGAENVSRKVIESFAPGSGALAVDNPVDEPEMRGDAVEELGSLRLKPLLEAVAEAAGKQLDGQQIRLALFGDAALSPCATIGPQAATGNDVMDMGMVGELPAPGVKDAKEAEFASEVARDARNLLKGRRALIEEDLVEELLMRGARSAQLFGQGEGDQKIRHGQEPFALAVKPRLRVGSAAFGT